MNLFLDIILKTVLMNAGRRRIVFSSFHADICTMVRHKQNKYPVLFLTQGESKLYPELMDLRSRTTSIAITFAQFENLLGINVHSEDLLRNPSFIKRAKSKGLVIFSWGDDANDPDNRKELRECGVHGQIYDRHTERTSADEDSAWGHVEKTRVMKMLKCFCKRHTDL
ncbi:glycerophosphocholine phosphodiesterase GPCPD1-like [Lathamus discolor]|uniref:glycerophosphocholine phosphodiesterase GPCPD1-like n=1 Tax=Lathamus discolor TaxID=678569 RepID=UPI0032B827C0